MKLRNLSPLQITLAISGALHALLLTVRFVDPESFNRVFQETPLEVILVNARTHEKPDSKAHAIAQTTLAGGGDADKGRATSPLPPSALMDVGDAMEDETQRKLQQMQEQQMLLLSQIKSQLAALPPRDPAQPLQTAEERDRKSTRLNSSH